MKQPHVIVCGLGFGDEGKGSVTDYLCSTGHYRTIVRYSGGANAGHNVVLPYSGRHHTFSQFGSGTLRPGIQTHLSRFMMVDPLALAAEYEHLRNLHASDALDRITIDAGALLITPWHRTANQIRERQRGSEKHGSCGVGIGETMNYALAHPDDAPRAGDCLYPSLLQMKLLLLHNHFIGEFGPSACPSTSPSVAEVVRTYLDFAAAVKIVPGSHLQNILDNGPVVFEGSQGILLDENYGFPPYNTWSTCTFKNAQTLLEETGHEGYRLGVIRTYMTRHGAGPLVTEDPDLSIAEPHNVDGPWQGPFRLGHFDAVAVRYALKVADGADGIALTHLDTAEAHPLKVCHEYNSSDGQRFTDIPVLGKPQPGKITQILQDAVPVYQQPDRPWPQIVELATGVPVTLGSHGPSHDTKQSFSPMDLTR